jgi:anti-anti-sigma factor
MLDFRFRTDDDDAVVVEVSGEICHDTVDDVRSYLDELLATSVRAVTIDVGAVTLLTAAGVSALVAVDRTLRARGATLSIRGARGLVRRVLVVCELSHLLADPATIDAA